MKRSRPRRCRRSRTRFRSCYGPGAEQPSSLGFRLEGGRTLQSHPWEHRGIIPGMKSRTDPGHAKKASTVTAYFARLPGEQKAIASTVDAIVARNAPGVKRAMKWNVPFYGLKGKGWFCAFAAFK